LSGGDDECGEHAGGDDDAVQDEDGSHSKTFPRPGGG
jgi:hypothetical protein